MQRTKWALYHELYIQWRRVLLSSLAVSGAAMLVSMLSWIGGNPASPNMLDQFGPFLIIWGVVVTSGVFAELREDAFRMEYLLRPAAAAEKVATKLLVSTLGYFVTFTVVYFTMNGILRGLYTLFYTTPSAVLTNPGSLVWEVFKAYLIVHSWFFLGAVYFRKHSGIKTLFAIVAVGISLALLTALMARLLFDPFMHGEGARLLEQRYGNPWSTGEFPRSIQATLESARSIGKAALILSVPGFWLLSWRRLKETEG
jgi:hypothetical protein